jgi:hypothetical protein
MVHTCLCMVSSQRSSPGELVDTMMMFVNVRYTHCCSTLDSSASIKETLQTSHSLSVAHYPSLRPRQPLPGRNSLRLTCQDLCHSTSHCLHDPIIGVPSNATTSTTRTHDTLEAVPQSANPLFSHRHVFLVSRSAIDHAYGVRVPERYRPR